MQKVMDKYGKIDILVNNAVIDVEDWDVDVCNFAPYKFFGVRGCGYAYVSDRVAAFLP